MIRIALCDDDARCLRDTQRFITTWLSTNNVHAEVSTFSDGDLLLCAFQAKPFDIIFLDIVMPLLNGIDTAQDLRSMSTACKIVFLSSSKDFAVESYTVKASNYLVKPPSFEHISAALEECIADVESEDYGIILKAGNGFQQLPLKNIEYIEAHNKHVKFYMDDARSFEVPEPLCALEAQLLTQERFFKTHRSYIVSIPHVDFFDMTKIITKSGNAVHIARGMGKQFHDAYFSYMFQLEKCLKC